MSQKHRATDKENVRSQGGMSSCKKVDDAYVVVLTLNVGINGRKILQETEAELSNMVLLVQEWLAKEGNPA